MKKIVLVISILASTSAGAFPQNDSMLGMQNRLFEVGSGDLSMSVTFSNVD